MEIPGTVDSHMSLYYENCNGDCLSTAQNITFCMDRSPGRTTTAKFANDETINMIKILIGKYRGIYIFSRKRPFLIKKIDFRSNFLMRPREFYPIDHLKRIQSGLMMANLIKHSYFKFHVFDSSFFGYFETFLMQILHFERFFRDIFDNFDHS